MFVRDVLVNGKSRFDELLDGVASGTLSANSVKNIFDLPFSEGLIRSLRLIPCSYLLYYFKPKEMLAIEMGEYYKGGARAQVVQKVENSCLSCTKSGSECEAERAGAARRRLLFRCGLRGD